MSYVDNGKRHIEELLERSVMGDAAAQYKLGKAYLGGRCVSQDYVIAVKWFGLAAEQGNADAMISLGRCYISGNGVEKNAPEGIRLWTAAADAGNTKAMAMLASLYYNGSYGFDVDYNKAFEWYTKADLKAAMGKCYLYGHGVEKSYEMAFKCFNEADDKDMLGECYLHGFGVERNVEKTIELWESACEERPRYYNLMFKLGHLYGDGIEMPPSYEKALEWWYMLAESDEGIFGEGFPEAMYQLACYYYEGRGVKKDVNRALKYFRRTIDLFYSKNKEGIYYIEYDREGLEIKSHYRKIDGKITISDEPPFVICSRKILIQNRAKSVINQTKKAAGNGDEQAAKMLRELGIEFASPERSTPISSVTPAKAITREAPERKPPIDIVVGESVFHKTFGEGTVCESGDGYISVEFNIGKKRFLNPEAFNEGFLNF